MLICVFLCFFAVAINCGIHGWNTGNIYKYDYKGCYRVANGSDISVGHFKADLYIRPLSNDKWSVTLLNPKERSTEGANEAENCETFPLDAPDFTNGSHSDEPFEISWKNGIVTALYVRQNAKRDEYLLIKTISSQLQLDFQGENCAASRPCQLPTETRPIAAYQTVENSTAGVCASQYEVSPYLGIKFDEKKQLFKVVKTADYKKCSPCSTAGVANSKRDRFGSLKNTNRVIVSGNMNEYTIQSINSTLEGTGLPLYGYLPGSTMIWVTNLTLASTYPVDGHLRNVTNPQKVNLETWC